MKKVLAIKILSLLAASAYGAPCCIGAPLPSQDKTAGTKAAGTKTVDTKAAGAKAAGAKAADAKTVDAKAVRFFFPIDSSNRASVLAQASSLEKSTEKAPNNVYVSKSGVYYSISNKAVIQSDPIKRAAYALLLSLSPEQIEFMNSHNLSSQDLNDSQIKLLKNFLHLLYPQESWDTENFKVVFYYNLYGNCDVSCGDTDFPFVALWDCSTGSSLIEAPKNVAIKPARRVRGGFCANKDYSSKKNQEVKLGSIIDFWRNDGMNIRTSKDVDLNQLILLSAGSYSFEDMMELLSSSLNLSSRKVGGLTFIYEQDAKSIEMNILKTLIGYNPPKDQKFLFPWDWFTQEKGIPFLSLDGAQKKVLIDGIEAKSGKAKFDGICSANFAVESYMGGAIRSGAFTRGFEYQIR